MSTNQVKPSSYSNKNYNKNKKNDLNEKKQLKDKKNSFKKDNIKTKQTKTKSTIPREQPKKTYRISIRKLPVKDFTQDDFLTCLDRVCIESKNVLQREVFTFEHFILGKLRYLS